MTQKLGNMELEAHGYKYIIGAKIKNESQEVKSWILEQPKRDCQMVEHPSLRVGGKIRKEKSFLPFLKYGKELHLHAYALKMPHPSGGILEVYAPL